MNSHFIEESSLSIAWGRAIRAVSAPGIWEHAPLIVSITGFDQNCLVEETASVRNEVDELLKNLGKQTVETVAGTIFPQQLWNPGMDRALLYQRYRKIFDRVKRSSTKNKHGIYFDRMINGGPDAHPNQLEFVVNAYLSRNEVRRSMLQIGIFNPKVDVTTAAQRGFPCLQHVTLAPSGDKLSINAFYATQYMVERAYGNYLGLCRLGAFAAHEMGLKLERVTCYSGIALFDDKVPKSKLKPVLGVVNQLRPPQ